MYENTLCTLKYHTNGENACVCIYVFTHQHIITLYVVYKDLLKSRFLHYAFSDPLKAPSKTQSFKLLPCHWPLILCIFIYLQRIG